MGWTLKRADGSYRCWNANAKDDVPRTDETWEEQDDSPLITRDPLTPAEINAQAAAALTAAKVTIAFLEWHLVDKHSLTTAQAKATIVAALPLIKTIYKSL